MRVGVLSLGGILLIVACGGGGTDPGGGGGDGGGGTLVHAARVTAGSSLVFTPDVQTIAPTDTIYFTFASAVQHSVVFTPATGVPADVPITTNNTVKRIFPTAGTYDYHCGVHGPSMSGRIVVQ
jgi:plastocyanin